MACSMPLAGLSSFIVFLAFLNLSLHWFWSAFFLIVQKFIFKNINTTHFLWHERALPYFVPIKLKTVLCMCLGKKKNMSGPQMCSFIYMYINRFYLYRSNIKISCFLCIKIVCTLKIKCSVFIRKIIWVIVEKSRK